MSLYKERGYETPRINIIITARRFVRSHKNDIFSNEGNKAFMTCGMVSPIMIQKAIMPPNALESISRHQ